MLTARMLLAPANNEQNKPYRIKRRQYRGQVRVYGKEQDHLQHEVQYQPDSCDSEILVFNPHALFIR